MRKIDHRYPADTGKVKDIESALSYSVAGNDRALFLDRCPSIIDFLKPEQSVILAEQQLRAMGLDLDDASRRRLLQWQTLTPGDFAAVERQSRFRPLNCAAAFVDRLGEEIKVKGLPSARKIGFC